MIIVSSTIPIPLQHQLEDAVKKMKEIMASKSSEHDQLEELIIIDTIQRLGLEFYFHEEIHAALERLYAKRSTLGEGDNDLHEVALSFRLLKQEGYDINSDIFNKFKNKFRKFDQNLCNDIKGLTSLFEASQMCIQGDDILDEAKEFSEKLLKTSLMNVKQSEARIIRSTLHNPYQKSFKILMVKSFFLNLNISLKVLHDVKATDGWTNEVQDLARMNFNIVQITHQNEITQFTSWWKEVRFAEELKLARNQPVKWYMWSLAALPCPTMGEERIELTKSISLIYLIDDIFDVYGTLEELTLFTEAVNRWEYADIKGLPDYMKKCLSVLHDTTNEISHKIYTKHGWDPKDSIRTTWVDLCNAFLVEAKWFSSGHIPCTEEYLKNGIVSSGVPLALIHVFYLLGQGISSKSIALLNSFPNIISSTATILRLWDDLGSAKDENQNGHDGSFIDCYMNEHKDSSAEQARNKVCQLISDAWKCLNEGLLSTSPFSANFTKSCLNSARMVPTMYSYDDNHHLPDLEKHMKSLFYEKIN